MKRRRFVIETVNGDEPVGPAEEKRKVVAAANEVEKKKAEEVKPRATPPVVRFAGEKEDKVKPVPKRASVSTIMHKQPELYEF